MTEGDSGPRGAAAPPPAWNLRWLVSGGLLFLALTVGVVWYQFNQIQAGDAAPSWDDLRWGYLVLILLGPVGETLASGGRIWLAARTLGHPISLWASLRSELANVGLAMVTPSQSGGGVAQVFVLNRAGLSVGTAVTVSTVSFLGTLAALPLLGLFALDTADGGNLSLLLRVSVGGLIALLALILVTVAWAGALHRVLGAGSYCWWILLWRRPARVEWRIPEGEPNAGQVHVMGPFAAMLSDNAYSYRDGVLEFLRRGKLAFVGVCALSLVYFGIRLFSAFACLRFLGIDGPTLGEVLVVQAAVNFLVFFAPTPGAAGLAEGASMSLTHAFLTSAVVPYYHLLWRTGTLYIQGIAGLICVAYATLNPHSPSGSAPGPVPPPPVEPRQAPTGSPAGVSDSRL